MMETYMLDESKQVLKKKLLEIQSVPESKINEFVNEWKSIELKKNEILINIGELQKGHYFVLEGALKSSFWHDDREIVEAILPVGKFAGHPNSIFFGAPSEVVVEAVQKSKLLYLSFSEINHFLDTCSEIDNLYSKCKEIYSVGVLKRIHQLMAMTIKERFVSYASKNPSIIATVPHKIIASYLRIDPTNFSKLFNQVRF